MQNLKTPSLVLAIVVGLVGLALVLEGQHPRLLAYYWQNQLDRVPDDRARELLGRIGELDEEGIPVLVEALGSRRESVARAAGKVLAERMERWTTLPPREASPKLLVLAEALAASVSEFGPTARRDAEQLTTWILRWQPDDERIDRADLIALCRQVLESTGRQHREIGTPGQFVGISEGASPERELPKPTSIAVLAKMPGGGLPIDVHPETVTPPERLEQPRVADGRHLKARPIGARPIEQRPVPDPRPNTGLRLLPHPEGHGPAPIVPPLQRSPLAPPPTAAVLARPLDAVASDAQENLLGMDSLELMRRLRASGGDATARIRAELMRRGFTEVHLELARRLFDPDPAVRIELAEKLPGLQTVDSAVWLFWLSEDKAPEVRLVAITLLATTSDPVLLRRVRRMAAADPDPRIRRQAERIAQRPASVRQR